MTNDCNSFPTSGMKPPEPITISVNQEHFRKKFQKVFEQWEDELFIGLTIQDQKDFLNELIKTMSNDNDQ